MSDSNRFVAKKGLLIKPYDGISQDAILKTNTLGHVITGATFNDLSNTSHTHLWSDLSTTAHTHDERYYTITQIDTNFLSASTINTLRTQNVVTTTGNTPILIGTISGFTSGSYIVENYITANKSITEYGMWKRTLGIVTTGSTPIIVFEEDDLDVCSSGFTGSAISYSSITSNEIQIYVTGHDSNTYNWISYYEVVDDGSNVTLQNTSYIQTNVNYVLSSSNDTIEVLSPCTITLPTSIGSVGKKYRIINVSIGNVMVNTTSSQTIGNKSVGNPSTITLNPEEWLDVQSNDINWRII